MSCPICGLETTKRYRPFCSRRCADLDLAKWLNESYAVPSQELEDVDDPNPTNENKVPRPH